MNELLMTRRVAGVLLAVLAGLATMAAATGSAGWTVLQLAGTTPTGAEASVTGVSCPGASSCLAVGYYTEDTGKQPLAESWNGSAWSAQAPVVPAGGSDLNLLAVSCPGASSCQAVGHYQNDVVGPEALAETWDGSRWTAVTPPAPAGASNPILAGISCTAAASCEAVGYYVDAGGGFAPLAETERQGTWTAGTPPLPRGGAEGLLLGVSCWAASACEAVGQYFNAAGRGLPFAETWNGSTWKASVPPVVAGASGVLYGVSCPAPGNCWASGVYTAASTRPLAEFWNGTAWSAQTPPTPSGGSDPVLFGISCESASACHAVGGYVDRAGATEPIAETLHGSAWAASTPPAPAGVTNPALAAVSCPSGSLCQAVGAYTITASDTAKALVETWSGGAGWSESTWPNPLGPPDATLMGVACPSASSCLAAGYDIDSKGGYGLLTELWQGHNWTASIPPAPPGGSEPRLAAISCGAPDSCVAAGSYVTSAGVPMPLAEAWNGATWTAATPPLPTGATQGGLYAVSCASASHCQAVGYSVGVGAATEPLAETWNGATWTAATPPLPSGGEHPELAAVSCPTVSWCMAAGQYIGPAGSIVPLAEQWRDGKWAAGSPPPPAKAQAARLYAVSCASVSVCEAVGEYEGPTGNGRPLAEAWQSGTWTAQTPPTPARAARPALTGVSCQAGNCLAVGGYQVAGDAVPPDRPLADSLQGQTWTLAAVPLPPGAAGSTLSAVACGTANCVSAGTDSVRTGAVYPMVATFRRR